MVVHFLPGQVLQFAPILSEWAGGLRTSRLAVPARTILEVREVQPLPLVSPGDWGDE